MFAPPDGAPAPGFRIWRDPRASIWRLRWRGERGRFSGSISWDQPAEAVAHGFSDGDTLRTSDNRVEFETDATDGSEKGLDIATPSISHAPLGLTFDLKIDGKSARAQTYVSKLGARPWSMPFSLGAFKPLWVKPRYRAGEDVGYYLWTDPRTGNWHLEWSSDSRSRVFTGTVKTPGTSVEIVATSSQDIEVEDSGSAEMRFRAQATGDKGGLIFLPGGWQQKGNFRLNLKIDGQPAKVHMGYGHAVEGGTLALPFAHNVARDGVTCTGIDEAEVIVRRGGVVVRDSGAQSGKIEVRIVEEPSSFAGTPPGAAHNPPPAAAVVSGNLRLYNSPTQAFRRFADRHSAIWGDFSNDGRPDLYISNGGGRGAGNAAGG